MSYQNNNTSMQNMQQNIERLQNELTCITVRMFELKQFKPAIMYCKKMIIAQYQKTGLIDIPNDLCTTNEIKEFTLHSVLSQVRILQKKYNRLLLRSITLYKESTKHIQHSQQYDSDSDSGSFSVSDNITPDGNNAEQSNHSDSTSISDHPSDFDSEYWYGFNDKDTPIGPPSNVLPIKQNKKKRRLPPPPHRNPPPPPINDKMCPNDIHNHDIYEQQSRERQVWNLNSNPSPPETWPKADWVHEEQRHFIASHSRIRTTKQNNCIVKSCFV
ncbi:MAG: hypothetical protein GY828_00640 [Candidatus Gracilibacteria bacterium]|nr:hypothetical protein [Candidatus Gracilibacteria bacterium]